MAPPPVSGPPQQGRWPDPPPGPPGPPQAPPPPPVWPQARPGSGPGPWASPPSPWQPAPGRPPRRPSDHTTLGSLALLLGSATLLLSGLVLPMLIPEGSHWLSGPTLNQYGPHLLGGESDFVLYFFTGMAITTAVVGIALLLGTARLLTRSAALLLGVVATAALLGSLFLTLVLVLGATLEARATVGLAAWSLPLGYLGTMAATFVPSLRDGWVRPGRR